MLTNIIVIACKVFSPVQLFSQIISFQCIGKVSNIATTYYYENSSFLFVIKEKQKEIDLKVGGT
jgi:hypothetical protein